MLLTYPSSSLLRELISQTRNLFCKSWPTLFFALLALFILYLFLLSLRKRSDIRRLGSFAPSVPSYLPFGLDVVRRSIQCSRKNEDFKFWSWLFTQSPHKGSPTVETYIGRQRFIFTADPENIKAILATQFQDFGKGTAFHDQWKHFLGSGIFNTDGEEWQANRRLLRPQFAKERIRDLDIFEKHVQKMMTKIGGQGQETDIAELFYRYTLDAATDYLLGHSVETLDKPKVDFAEAFNEVQRMQAAIMRLGPLQFLVPKSSLWRALKVVDAFVEPFIDQALKMDVEDLKQLSSQDHSFLQAVAVTGTRDRKVIRDQIVNILLAGRDTTAGILSFMFLELSRHPEIVIKLRDEVLARIGIDARPTYQDLNDMPYLKSTINEVLRLYPVLPYNVSLQRTHASIHG